MWRVCEHVSSYWSKQTSRNLRGALQLLPLGSWCHLLFKNHLCSRCLQNTQPALSSPPIHPDNMKCLNNRADSHLTGQVEYEMEGAGNGAWVNNGFCNTPPSVPRAVSTIYNTQPHFQGSGHVLYKPDPLTTFPEAPASVEQNLVKKPRGCCLFIKGRNTFTAVQLLKYAVLPYL